MEASTSYTHSNGVAEASGESMTAPVLDAKELNQLAEFAELGGLGVADALVNVVAEHPDQLMFLTNDKLVILRDMGPVLVASCEGVVGWVRREDVRFNRPQSPGHADVLGSPMSKSQSGRSLRLQADVSADQGRQGGLTLAPGEGAEAGLVQGEGGGGFKSIVVSPSPPQHRVLLPESQGMHQSVATEDPSIPGTNNDPYSASYQTPARQAHDEREDDPSPNLSPFPSPGFTDQQRISNQFDFDSSPLHTPGSDTLGSSFVDVRAGMPVPTTGDIPATSQAGSLAEAGAQPQRPEADYSVGEGHVDEQEQLRERTESRATRTRESIASMTSMQSDTSSALGGIGGLLLGGGGGHGGSMSADGASLQRLMSGSPSPPLLYSMESPVGGQNIAGQVSTFAAAQAAAMASNAMTNAKADTKADAEHRGLALAASPSHAQADTSPPKRNIDLSSPVPTPLPLSPQTSSNPIPTSPTSPAYSTHSAASAATVGSVGSAATGSSWDVYETYSRESMYVKPGQLAALGVGKGSKSPPPLPAHIQGMMEMRKRATMIGAAASDQQVRDEEVQGSGEGETHDETAEEVPATSAPTSPVHLNTGIEPTRHNVAHENVDTASPAFTLLPPPGGRKRSIASQIFLDTNAQLSPEKAQTQLPATSAPRASLAVGAGARGANRRSDIMSFASMFSDGSFDEDSAPFAAARQALERVGMIREAVEEEKEEGDASGREDGEAEGEVSAGRRLSDASTGYAEAAPPRPPGRQATFEDTDGQTNEEFRHVRDVGLEAVGNGSARIRTSSARSGGSTPSSATAPGAPISHRSPDSPLPAQTRPAVTSAHSISKRDARSSAATSASTEGEIQKLGTSIGPLRLANPDDASETASSQDLSPISPTSPGSASGGPAQSTLPPLSVGTTTTSPYDPDFTPSAPGSYVDHSFGHSEADTPVSCKILTPHTGSEAQDHAQSRAGSPGPGLVTPLAMSRDPSSQGDMHIGSKVVSGGKSKGMRTDTDEAGTVLGSPFPTMGTPDGTPILAALPPRKASAVGLVHSATPHGLDQRRPSADHGLAAGAADVQGRSPIPSPSLAVATPPMGHAQWTPTLNGGSPVIGPGSQTGSPHSAAATRQAVEMGKNTPPVTRGQRSATLTLVGNTTVDLAASRGPVPIMFTVGDPAQAHIMREGARLREAAAAAAAGSGGGGGGVGIGLGLPTNLGGSGRVSPSAGSPNMSNSAFGDERRPSSPLVAMALAAPFMEDTAAALKSAPSPYPQMQPRSATLPIGERKGQGGINGAGTMPASPVIGDFGNLRYPSPHAASMSAASSRGTQGKSPAQAPAPNALAGPSQQRSESSQMPTPSAADATRRPSANAPNVSPSTDANIAKGITASARPSANAIEATQAEGKTKSGIFQRQRSRSFSAAMNKALGRKSGTGPGDAPAMPPTRPPPPSTGLDMPASLAASPLAPSSPSTNGPGVNSLGKRPAFARQASLPNQPGQDADKIASSSARAPPLPPIDTSMLMKVGNDAISPRTLTQQNGNGSPTIRSPQPLPASQASNAGINFGGSVAPRKDSTPTVIIPAPNRSASPAPISPPPARPESPNVVGLHPQAAQSAHGTPSSIRTASGGIGGFTFRRPSGAKGSKTSIGSNGPGTPTGRASPLPMPSPVSHKDFIREEAKSTIKEDGVAFEMIQPKKSIPPNANGSSDEDPSSLSPKSGLLSSPDKLGAFSHSATSLDTLSVLGGGSSFHGHGDELERRPTMTTMKSSQSGMSSRTLPETDEWGFVLSMGTTPEIYLGRAEGAEQRANEMKWLSIINTPLNGPPAKRVRKLAIEHGIPASLRGKVWAWFMAGHMSAKRPGLYHELLDHWRGKDELGKQIDDDVDAAYPDHSIYSGTSTGQSDLRAILRAYSNFATSGYRSEMALVAGMLLIHCVAEDAFWLFAGFVNGVLRDYYAAPAASPMHGLAATQKMQVKGRDGISIGMKVDSGVFERVLYGSEPRIGKLFKELGVQPVMFLSRWWTRLYLRCLPWPTALRVIDAVIAEGPRFLIITALAILTVSKERLLGLPRDAASIVKYLNNLPQDALLLPDSFMKACENVKFREEDYRKLRGGVEKEVLAATSA